MVAIDDGYGGIVQVQNPDVPAAVPDISSDHHLQNSNGIQDPFTNLCWIPKKKSTPGSLTEDRLPTDKTKDQLRAKENWQSDAYRIKLLTIVDPRIIQAHMFGGGVHLQPLSEDEVYALSTGHLVKRPFDLGSVLASDVLRQMGGQIGQVFRPNDSLSSSRFFQISYQNRSGSNTTEKYPYFFDPVFKLVDQQGMVSQRTFYVGDVMYMGPFIDDDSGIIDVKKVWGNCSFPSKDDVDTLQSIRRTVEKSHGVTPIFAERFRPVVVIPRRFDGVKWRDAVIALLCPGDVVLDRFGNPTFIFEALKREKDQFDSAERSQVKQVIIGVEAEMYVGRTVIGYIRRVAQGYKGVAIAAPN